MIDSKERARRDQAHTKADMAWAKAYPHRSRTGGLGDLVRSIDAGPSTTPPEVRKLRQDTHKRRLRDATARATKNGRPWDPRKLDRSRYFPHQSDRERTRGERQAARRSA